MQKLKFPLTMNLMLEEILLEYVPCICNKGIAILGSLVKYQINHQFKNLSNILNSYTTITDTSQTENSCICIPVLYCTLRRSRLSQGLGITSIFLSRNVNCFVIRFHNSFLRLVVIWLFSLSFWVECI